MAMNFHFFPCPICHMELFWELREITVCVCMYVCVCVCVCVYICIYGLLLFSQSVVSNSLWLHVLQNSQDFLSFTICQNLFTLMCVELVMPSNHLILCRCLLLLPSIFPNVRVFPNELALHVRWSNCWWSLASALSQGWFPLGLTGLLSWLSKGLSRVFCSTVWKHQFFGTQPSWWSNSHIYMVLNGCNDTSESQNQ